MDHADPSLLAALDLSWDEERGILGKLRTGRFDRRLADEYLGLLSTIEPPEKGYFHADFVRLLWFAPLYCEWQVERVVEQGNDEPEVIEFCRQVRQSVTAILGSPCTWDLSRA